MNEYGNQLAHDDIEFLMSLIPETRKKVPPGLCPTMYVTGRYEEDIKIAKRLEDIQARLNGGAWFEPGY